MKLKFDSKLDFQIEVINSIIDLFKGQTNQIKNLISQGVPNILGLSKEKILENLQEVQKRNGSPVSNDLQEPFFSHSALREG